MNRKLIQERYKEFWDKQNKTPILLLKGKKGELILPTKPESVREEWMNIEYLLEKERAILANTAYVGDAFPCVNPNLGPDILGAALGAELVFEETTSYSIPFVKDWSEDFSFHPDNRYWNKVVEITKAFTEDSKGDYLVGITDLHAGADGLVSIRGPQELCFDIYDQPEVFEYTSKILLPAFQQQFDELYGITQKIQKGTTNWMGLYKEEPWYVTSSDFICMISTEDFEELIYPELQEEIAFLKGNTIFHLDGPGALKHLDTLLQIPDLAGIQWVYGAGQPSAKHWLPVLKKIQDAGKIVNIGLQRDDIDVIFTELRPEGLSCYFDFEYSEKEAYDIYERIQTFYR